MDRFPARTFYVLLILSMSGAVACSDVSPDRSDLLEPNAPAFDIDQCDGTHIDLSELPSGTGPGHDVTAKASLGGSQCYAIGFFSWRSKNPNVVDVISSTPNPSLQSTATLRGGSQPGTTWIIAEAYDYDRNFFHTKADSFQVTNSNTVAAIDFNLSLVSVRGDNTPTVIAYPLNEFFFSVPGNVSFSLNPSGVVSMTPAGTNKVTLEMIAPGSTILTASLGAVSEDIVVNAYHDYSVSVSGPVNHCLSSPPPVYTASASGGSGAPYHYQWWVDGVSQMYQGSDTFEWTGVTAGAHEIVVEVYNVAADTLVSHIHSYC